MAEPRAAQEPVVTDRSVTKLLKRRVVKYVILALYVLITLLAPLLYLLPPAQQRTDRLVKTILPTAVDDEFRTFITFLKHGDTTQAYSMTSPEFKKVTNEDDFKKISGLLVEPDGTVEIVNAGYRTTASSRYGTYTNYNAIYEVSNEGSQYPHVLVSISSHESDGVRRITSANLNQFTNSLEERAKFDLKKHGPYLALAILMHLLIAGMAFRYLLRVKDPRWVPLLVILLVSAYLTVTPTRSTVNFGAYGFVTKAGAYGSWSFAIPIPLGVAYYFVKRKKYELPNGPVPDVQAETAMKP